jgi:hypothetical protein
MKFLNKLVNKLWEYLPKTILAFIACVIIYNITKYGGYEAVAFILVFIWFIGSLSDSDKSTAVLP